MTATIALVAGGYLVMSGVTAEPAASQSSNETNKEGKVIAAAESNEARKGGKLIEVGASSNEAAKQGKPIEASASSNEAAKQGKPIEASASTNEATKQGRPIAASASSNEAAKQGKPIEASASTNGASKEGKAIPVSPGAPRVDRAEVRADAQYVEKYYEEKTADKTSDPAASSNEDDKEDLFLPGPQYDKNYNAEKNVDIYGAKQNVATARPLIEVGREQYTAGEYSPENSFLGKNNLLIPGLAIYGDWRTAVAFNQNNGEDIAQIATRVNIDVDFKITGTERIHAFFTPLQDNAKFTRCEFGGGGVDEEKCILEFDPNPQTLFFEGDVGSIWAGLTGTESSFDLPVTAGLFPLFLQNGIWANDAVLGGAVSLTAKNSQQLGIPNYDITFFTAFDNVDNALIKSDVSANRNNNIANIYGVTAFIDAFDGYVETGYGLIQGVDDNVDGQLTNFLTAAYTRRYANTLSNTTRVFANFGDGEQDEGLLFISENSIISGLPSTLLPYGNFFVGFENPQPLVDGNGAGLLKNVGISFETDALTGFPKLNDTGSNAYGGAVGLQYLFNLDQQLVFELATVQPFGDVVPGVGVADAQYAASVRYQIPINKDWLFRADATYQLVDNPDIEDNFGIRGELRRKF
jgi:hypothetical protein